MRLIATKRLFSQSQWSAAMRPRITFYFLWPIYLGMIMSLTACGTKDGAEALGKGYYFNTWGNHFISRKSLFENKESIIVDSQVINYSLKQHKYLLVEQIPELAQQQWQKHIYWLIDMETHQSQTYTDINTFEKSLKAMHIIEQNAQSIWQS